jgi:hypothetical protein
MDNGFMDVDDGFDYDGEDWLEGEFDLLNAAIAAVQALFTFDPPTVQHNSVLTGHLYYREIMDTLNVARFRDATRMDKATFGKLLDLLTRDEDGSALEDSFGRRCAISAGEKLLTFLQLATGMTLRKVCKTLHYYQDWCFLFI